MFAATYYDGRSARRQDVELRFDGAWIELRGAQLLRRERLAEAEVSEALASAPRLLRFGDGTYCEIADTPQLRVQLAAAGYRESWIQRWQSSTRAALLAGGLFVVVAAAMYAWGLPWGVSVAAAHMPDGVTEHLGAGTLDFVDAHLAEDSALDEQRQAALQLRFRQLARQQGLPPSTRLVFRASPALGPNAFALPDGTVVLLDELVALAEHDDQILAVVAHELGHVHHRHGLRLLLRSSIIGAAMLWWVGDATALLAAAPAALLNARYSRTLEAEADAYAAAALQARGLSPGLLADMLEKLTAAARAARKGDAEGADYLDTHPAPSDRIAALRQAR